MSFNTPRHLNPVFVLIFFFPRWSSCSSNRRLRLLKVNLHLIMSFMLFSTRGKQSLYVLFIHAALVGFESNNKYEVRNSMGQNVFYAVEENDCLSRQCCGPLRPFTIHVLDNFGQEVITVTRPLKCMSCFFPCCLQEVSEATCCVLRWFSSFYKFF